MIEVSNLTAQTLQPGQAITFDKLLHKSGNCECWSSQLPTSVKLRAGCNAVYDIEFAGNISGAAATTLQLAIAVQGQPLVETAMNSTPSTADVPNNVATGTYLKMGCADLDRISVVNNGTAEVTVAPNSNLRIRRVA